MIVLAHAREDGGSQILDDLATQTRQPQEVLFYYSDMVPDIRPGIGYMACPNLNDYGHEKRATGLQHAQGDYVTFWNADDRYHPTFIEKLSDLANQLAVDIVACDFNSHMGWPAMVTEPKEGRITSGNFLVAREKALEVGYNHRIYNADWQFIRELTEAGATFARLPEVLYDHL